MLIFLLFFGLWLLFNGRVAFDVVLFGIVLGAAVSFFACRICGWALAGSRHVFRLLPRLLAYAARLFWEIIKASLAVLRVILTPKSRQGTPVLFRFDCHLNRKTFQTALANSITITPGTYTVAVDGRYLTVHALDEHFARVEPGSGLNRHLISIEKRAEEIP